MYLGGEEGGGAKYVNYIKRDKQQSIVRIVLAFYRLSLLLVCLGFCEKKLKVKVFNSRVPK